MPVGDRVWDFVSAEEAVVVSALKRPVSVGLALLIYTTTGRAFASAPASVGHRSAADVVDTTTAPSDEARRAALAEAEAGYKKISDEVARHDDDTAAAEKAADSPPPDIPADKRQAYIDQRKNEAQAASDAATEARERLKEAAKAVDEAKAALAAGHD